MALIITRRIMLCGLILLVSACVHPQHFYGGDHDNGHYRDRDNDDDDDRHHGDRHDRDGGGNRHRDNGHRD